MFAFQASSFVYVFSEKLRKIQSLKTNNPSQALSYEFENERYILILDDQLYKTYRWNGETFAESYTKFYCKN